jgi:hypothetical protein
LSSGATTDNLSEYFQILEDGTLRYVTSGDGTTTEAVLTRR